MGPMLLDVIMHHRHSSRTRTLDNTVNPHGTHKETTRPAKHRKMKNTHTLLLQNLTGRLGNEKT